MVAADVEIGEVVQRVVDELNGSIQVSKVILFGSYANGAPRKWSDIDVAIISPDFSGVPLWRRQEILAENLREADVRLSPLGYSPEESSDPDRHSFLHEIIRTGRVVYEDPKA
jgi:predicted nucleotidyltransferase